MLNILLSNSILMALITSFCLAVCVPMIGGFLLVQRKSGLVDSIAHISMLGSALAAWMSFNIYVFAIVLAVVFCLGVFEIGSKIKHKEAILALSTGFSLAFIALIKKISSVRINLESIFYGNINSIGLQDLVWIVLTLVLTVITIVLFYKEFLWISIDEDLAKVQGIKVARSRIIFNILAALVFASFIQIFGIVTVLLISIAPILIASSNAKGFKNKLMVSIFIAIIALWSSVIASYFWLDYSVSSILAVILLVSLTFNYTLTKIRTKILSVSN
jgi:zinc transport system permease protein